MRPESSREESVMEQLGRRLRRAIAFTARRDDGVDGVYRVDGRRLTTIVGETGGYDFFGRATRPSTRRVPCPSPPRSMTTKVRRSCAGAAGR
jgi:hypothetical protein